MTERFSKQALAHELRGVIEGAETEAKTIGIKFDPGNGYAQVKGKGEQANRLYGIWYAARSLMSQFQLRKY